MTAPTRERFVTQTAQLLRVQGYAATGVQQIVAAAKAPFGSLYHHFPGGKVDLAAEAIRTSGAAYVALVPAVFDPAPDLPTGVRAFFTAAAEHLVATGYADACPIATVALEVASTNETLRQATADVFDGWLDYGTGYFTGRGLSADLARELTLALVTALEGAFVLDRATRRTDALSMAGELVSTWLGERLRARPAAGPRSAAPRTS
jgi:AcrR family transcriptional regulator